MPMARVNGVNLAYQVLGTEGPWLALSPGGRRGMAELLPIAELLAARRLRLSRQPVTRRPLKISE